MKRYIRTMTDDEVRYAIENNKPFDIDSFRRYWGSDKPKDSNAVKAEDIEVGRVYVNTESADMLNIGDTFEVLDKRISTDPAFKGDIEMDIYDQTTGTEFTVWYSPDEYVGVLVE